MRLNKTLLCIDCEEIFESTNGHNPCPSCGSEASYLVIHFINRNGSLLASQAARAEEVFDIDELERFANDKRKENSNGITRNDSFQRE